MVSNKQVTRDGSSVFPRRKDNQKHVDFAYKLGQKINKGRRDKQIEPK